MFKRLLVLYILLLESIFAKESLTLGIGTTYFSTPAYIGSKSRNSMLLPFPYIEYRGKYFNVDRDKIYNQFLNKDRLKIEISLRGMLPVKSEGLRDGMDKLDTILELGPKFSYEFYKKGNLNLALEVPIRSAISIGKDGLNYEGFLSSLDFRYFNRLYNDINFIFITGFGYSDKKLNNYYYEVEKEHANSNRVEYHSRGGYSGFHNSFAITKKSDSFWYGAFIKHYYIKEASFENSPLVETNHALFYGAAFSYLF